MLGWSPSEFWSAYPSDFYCAMDGWTAANKTKGDEPGPDEPMVTPDEMFSLMKKFPDKV